MYEYILFDLDGTVTDSALGITNSVAYALEKINIEVKDKNELLRFIGPPLTVSFKEFYNLPEDKMTQAVGFYRERYGEVGLFENEVYSGIPELLEKLKKAGKKIILATSKPEEYASRILEHFDLLKYFDFVAGSTLTGLRNEKAAVIKYVLEENNITDLSSVIMVGDRKHDVIGAKENGVDTIGVLYGYGDEEELKKAGALHIAETPAGLGNLILSLSE